MALAGGGCWWAKKKRCSRSLAFKCKAWTRLSKTCVETLIGRPCSNQVYQSTLTPESCATSARRSPGARRLLPRGSPTSEGASRALLVRRKSPSSCKRWSCWSRPIVPSPSFVRLSSRERRSLTPMINARLVLVSLSVYTFGVSKTTFPRQGHGIDEYSCKEHSSSEEIVARETFRTGARMVWPHD